MSIKLFVKTQHEKGKPMDSVERDIDTWMAQMPTAEQPVEELRQRVGRLSRLFDQVLDEVAEAHRISRADWTALSVVIRHGGQCTPTHLARELGLTSGTVSTRIRRLTAAGLLSSTSAGDARSRPVTVTAAGRGLWTSATADRVGREASMVRAALDDRIGPTNALLADLLAGLEERLGTAGRHDLPADPSG